MFALFSSIKYFLFSAVPLRPENLTAFDITSRNVSLSWIEPLSNNAPIQNYSVRFMDPSFITGERNREVIAAQQMADIVELLPGVNYAFTVVAVNEIGESRPSLPLEVRTADEGMYIRMCCHRMCCHFVDLRFYFDVTIIA